MKYLSIQPVIRHASLLAISLMTPVLSAQAATLTSAAPAPTVDIGVYAQHSGGKIVYHYRVTNNTPLEISSVSIGRDSRNDADPANDVLDLSELPSGWNAKYGIPSASSNAPTGWRVSMTTADELVPAKDGAIKDTGKDISGKDAANTPPPMHAITWEVMNDKSPKLAAGQSMSRLSIALDKADPAYLNGPALVTFGEGTPITFPIQRLDNIPPQLTVNLSPNMLLPSNPKPIAVKASFALTDDYDRFPEIKLESITANEPLETGDVQDTSLGRDDRYIRLRAINKSPAGRVYTVTYSATDASGNQTLATATVSVATSDPAAASTPGTVTTTPANQPATEPLPPGR